MAELTGQIAAIGTAVLFGASSIVFTVAGRRAGASTVNRSRLLVASVLAIAVHWMSRGEPIPSQLPWSAWVWLGVSGIVGLAVGDELLFRAYVRVGPAPTMLVFSLAPAIAAFLGWVFLGERLSILEIFGVAITLTGVGWVVSAPKTTPHRGGRTAFVAGLLFALGGATGQALGLITAKVGLNAGASPQAANWIRLVIATAALWTVTVAASRVSRMLSVWRTDRASAGLIVLGAIFGPIAGVWLSLVAIERAPVGIASTLMSLTPLFLLPMGRLVFGERMTLRALAGTVFALVGVTLLLR